jgi:rhodanese-related sulfurtransferase/DNA-binding transcriptional ArsR family regulator
MGGNSPKGLLYEQFARVGKALSNSHRLEILEFLAQGGKSVEKLAEIAGLTVANTSQHLQALRHAGLVSARKESQKVFYTISDDSIIDLIGALRHVAEKNLAEVDVIVNSFFKVKDDMEPLSPDELLKRIDEGFVTVLDVRPPDEYAAGHLPGAVNVMVKDLEKYMKEFDPKSEIVAYCRGPYCLMSFDAVEKLRKKGFKARRLEDGFPEWKKAGRPVAK